MMNSKLFALLLLVSAWPAQGATDNARRESSAGTKPPAPARVDASTARQPAPVATAATHPARPPKRYVPMTEALGGPTWDFAHKGLWVTWPRGGSWFDADGVAQGEKPFASARIDSSNVWVSFNATRLVKLLLADNTGIFVRGLRRTGASAPPKIAALPSPEAAKLAIVTSTGKFELRPVMDAWIDVSTNREMVNLDFWQASGGILTWDFSGVTGTLESATLSVFVKNSYGGPGFDAGLFLLDRPEVLVQPELQHPDRVEQGLANTVARDQDLEKLDAVYFYVEGPEIRQKMSNGWVDNDYGKAAIVDYPAYGLRLLEGSNGPLLATAFHPRLQFLDVPRVDNKKPKSTFKLGQVPEEVYVRYLIEYPADNDPRGLWLGTKLPGASSCYYGQYAWAPSASNPAEKPYLQKPDDCFGFAIAVAPPVPVEVHVRPCRRADDQSESRGHLHHQRRHEAGAALQRRVPRQGEHARFRRGSVETRRHLHPVDQRREGLPQRTARVPPARLRPDPDAVRRRSHARRRRRAQQPAALAAGRHRRREAVHRAAEEDPVTCRSPAPIPAFPHLSRGEDLLHRD
jgi:hypothetical protein